MADPEVGENPLFAWAGRNSWWLIALGALLVSRGISTTAGLVEAHRHHLPWASVPGPNGQNRFKGYFTYWDSYWYVLAARYGWPHHFDPRVYSTWGFFPGLPVLLRAVHWVTGWGWVVVGVMVEAVVEVAAVLGVSVLARRVMGGPLGNYATVLFCLFPGAYVFSQVYSEPLYILGVVLCLYGLVRRWWWLGGAGAALAGLTRPSGLVLIACCFWVAGRELWLRRDRAPLVAAAIAPIGIGAVVNFDWLRTGAPLAYQKNQSQAWHQSLRLTTAADYVRAWLDPTRPPVGIESHASPRWIIPVFILGGAVALCLLAVLVVRHRWPSELLVYSLGAFALTLVTKGVGFRPRMGLSAVPMIFAVAWYLQRPPLRVLAIGASIVGLVYFSASIPWFVP